MSKLKLTRPVFIMLFGLPGSGKSFFSRQLSDELGVAHISSDRIRYELFEKPTYSKEEQMVIMNLMIMMAEEFIRAGMPIVFDISLNRAQDRKAMRELARRLGVESVLVWIQADAETCFGRSRTRDRRKSDDKYSVEITSDQFENIAKSMQLPNSENPLVVSGKHLFGGQKAVLVRKLRDMGAITEEIAGPMAKPELVNLVSRAQAEAGRVDMGRRNVIIR